MKALILTLVSSLTLANGLCDSSVWEALDSGKFVETYSSYETLDRDFFNTVPNLPEFDYEECKEAIKTITLKEVSTGELFTAYYTNEDSCDGGNSYGGIMNASGEFFASITDSDISCD